MNKEKEIMHDGVVLSLDGESMTVEILSKSACSGCAARSLCSSAEQKTKEVDVMIGKGERYEIGEKVTVVGSETMGLVAVVLCYVVPVILMVAMMAVLTYNGMSDVVVGLASLGVLVPYFVAIYLMRDRLKKRFVFRIRNKIE